MEGFSITSDNKLITKDLNRSFDSIKSIIDSWEPKETYQDFASFSYFGTLSKGQEIQTEKAYNDTDVYIFIRGSRIKAGTIKTSAETTTSYFVSAIDTKYDEDGEKAGESFNVLIWVPYRRAQKAV